MARLDQIRGKLNTLSGLMDDLSKAYDKGKKAPDHEEMVNAYTQAHADMDDINNLLDTVVMRAQNAVAVLSAK